MSKEASLLKKFCSLVIHADDGMEQENCVDVAAPMHLSTTFAVPNDANLVYARYDTITRRRVETILGKLENGKALTYASGMAAVCALLHFLKPTIVYISNGGYFAVHQSLQLYKKTIASHLPSTCNIDQVFVVKPLSELDTNEPQQQQVAATARVVIWLETPKNPDCKQEDIAYYVSKAKQLNNGKVVVDSTFATPILQRPLELGAHFVMHSGTKQLGGHSDLLAGVVVTNDTVAFQELNQQRNVEGNVMGNMEAWLLLRSLRTLPQRVIQQSKSATALALYLADQIPHGKVVKVYHPSLPSNTTDFEIASRQMDMPPGILSVELSSIEQAEKMPSLLNMFIDATSLGAVESLVDWRYKYDKSVPPGLLRLSIGLEYVDDLIEDWKQALQKL